MCHIKNSRPKRSAAYFSIQSYTCFYFRHTPGLVRVRVKPPFLPPSSLKSEIFSPQTVICIIVQRSYNISPNLVMNNTQVIQIYMTAHPVCVCVCVSSLLMYFVVFCRCDSGVSDISLNGFYSVLFAHVKLFAIPTNAHFTSRTI